MIIRLETHIKTQDKTKILQKLESLQCKVTEVRTNEAHYLVGFSKKNEFDIELVRKFTGVSEAHLVTDSYKLVSKQWKSTHSCLDLGDDIKIGNGHFAIIAGPCSIESEAQITQIIAHLIKNNIKIIRGGAFKPRSSPYAFRGLGIEGLKMFKALCQQHGIKIISEVMQISQIAPMYDYIDAYQVGARNSQNFNLLDELGKVDKPVLIKRGISGTIDELLQSAEYVFSGGNERLLLCERGIRTYETAYRNTFDINAIALLKSKSHLPVIADPSHGVGMREYVSAIALAATVAGADGVMFEVHQTPEEALSDGQQTLNFTESESLIKKINSLKDTMKTW